MRIALIISTYNWPEALQLCLQSVMKQTVKPEEIIIADDGSTTSTKDIIDRYRKISKRKIKHIWHEDKGFKLAEIRNKAISEATADYIIQIDGDVILHPHFIQDHKSFAKQNSFIKGRRLMIGKTKSENLLKQKSINVSFLSVDVKMREHGIRIPFFNKIFISKEERSADGVMGSNMAFWKKDFVAVNGYDNSLKGWGAEDKELAQRFVNLGMVKRKIKYGAIQYHIYHPQCDKSKHDEQIKVIEDLKSSKKTTCENGLSEISKDYQIYE
ncbi:glycosyltransferase family 2 protein [Chryseobacterium sp. KACC 21268]|nr:glycosyltransferase family 2 protein [Chryseobacterium sp. KACC 21268]